MSQRLATWLVKYRMLGSLFAVAFLVFSYAKLDELKYDWQVASMFAAGDPRVEAYRQLQDRLGGESVVLAVYQDEQLFTAAGLQRLRLTTGVLEEVQGVQAVFSLARVDALLTQLRKPTRLFSLGSRPTGPTPLLDPTDPLAAKLLEVFEGYTHNAQGNLAAIACLLDAEQTIDAQSSQEPIHLSTVARLRDAFHSALEAETDRGLHNTAVLIGEPVLIADGYSMVQGDGYRLGIASSIVVGLVLLVTLRSLRWMLAPLIIVAWAAVVTQGCIAALGLELTMISSTVNSVLTVVGVATCAHLLLSVEANRRQGLTPEAAVTKSLSTLLVPILWACITDALGFGSLLIANVGPVRDFGLTMSMGVGAIFVGTLLLFPMLSLVFNRPTKNDVPSKLAGWPERWLDGIAQWAIRRRLAVFSTTAALAVLAIIGCFRLELETDFTKNFDETTELVRGYRLVESELGGAGVWDILLPAPAKVTTEYVDQLAELQNQLRQIAVSDGRERLELTKVISLADAVETSSVDRLAGLAPLSIRMAAMQAALPEFMGTLLTNSPDERGLRWVRIMLRSPEQAPTELKAKLIHEVERTSTEFCGRREWLDLFGEGQSSQPQVTGYHVLLCSLVGSVLSDQWLCFGLATVLIGSAVWIATRSLRLAGIALIPNGLPILLILGGLGLSGQTANLGAALIAAVSIGLSVDSSIHYLLHYQRRLAEEVDSKRARKESVGACSLANLQRKAAMSAQKNVGQAASLATCALAAGFLTLASSQFKPTVTFGTLASAALLGGLLGNLILLPALLATRERNE